MGKCIMLLSQRGNQFHIPLTSTCVIHNKGPIHDGDVVEITSPIFASVNFSTKAIHMSDKISVIVHTESKSIIEHDPNNGELKGILVCNDNDIFNMYVKI